MTANLKQSTGEFLFADRRQMKIFQQNRYVNITEYCPVIYYIVSDRAIARLYGAVFPRDSLQPTALKKTKGCTQ